MEVGHPSGLYQATMMTMCGGGGAFGGSAPNVDDGGVQWR